MSTAITNELKNSRSGLFNSMSQTKLNIQATPEISSPPTPSTPVAGANQLVLRISYPSLKLQKAIRVASNELIWVVKRQAIEKGAQDVKDALNHGIFAPGVNGKAGKFLEEKREIGSYGIENNAALEFLPKTRTPPPGVSDADVAAANSKKELKKFIEDIKASNVDKVRERLNKGVDPNFWTEATQETPLSIAITQNEKEIVSLLIENGAFLDYRVGDLWKTPLHLAAAHNKSQICQALLSYGAWTNATDALGLTPLYYAATAGHIDIVVKLLSQKATPEIYDENGKGPLHQACLNNHDIIASLLLDSGANLNAVNQAGNTPLHVAATRNAKECAKWLLTRGCDREKSNKSGQTPSQAAMIAGNSELAELIKNFKPTDIVPPPPKLKPENEADMPMTLPANYPNIRFSQQQLNAAESTSNLGESTHSIPPGPAPVLARTGASSTVRGRPAGLEALMGSQASLHSAGQTMRGRPSSYDLKGVSRSPSLIPEDAPAALGLLARLGSLKRRKKFDAIVINGINVPAPPTTPQPKLKKSGSQLSLGAKSVRRQFSISSISGPSPSVRNADGHSLAPQEKSHISRSSSFADKDEPLRKDTTSSVHSLGPSPVLEAPILIKTLIDQAMNGQDVELDLDVLVENFKNMEGMLNKANERFAAVDQELHRLRIENERLKRN
ncbi:hypothetical protein SmJEL517_g00775 [Synchytrium microbalum]|uniref:Talin N-terminal F0 domain-containing protein n=1 Tax=Synchytrium microbalum TaxID=1806994 RepID=A0A507CDF8_9FUNG|nr:uncharacterized protein SmJEL517_g00775 [Synchytrium microbalum]TPX37652.1 hypothetical protein SmJEL517_g00775 [Synchytrium microbalum]